MLGCVQGSLGQEQKITYINFSHKSNLHFLMDKILKEYVRMRPRKSQGRRKNYLHQP